METIKHFKKIKAEDVTIAGGKGASLGELTRVGLPVPPGFVVLAEVFDNFLLETGLGTKIQAILKTVNYKSVNSVARASSGISRLIVKQHLPENLKAEIIKNFRSLKAEFVAVRSSATAEDSKTASWAGELETYLNVREKDLLNSVKKCWASLFTSRAIFYRSEKKLEKQKISVAVVVQKMVQSEISGICFTVHPVTKNRGQMVIEAGFGLGEAIVGGMITPDTYMVHKRNLKILDINVSEQRMIIVKTPKGNIEKKLTPSVGGKQKLTAKQITQLSKICKNIEKHYRAPQDIEWALEKNKFYITQSRPITTL